jgi:HEAT repeat protein
MVELWTVLPFLIGIGGFWLALQAGRQRLQLWEEAVTSCGLRVVEKSRFHGGWLKLEARKGPLQVWIEDARRKDVSTRIRVSIPGPPGFPGVRIRRETFIASPREIEIGDATFDATFSVEGPMRLLAVLLDGKARSLLMRANAECWGFGIAAGEILVNLRDMNVPLVLPLLLEIGRRFAEPVDVTERLAENVHQDPEVGARLLNLRLLLREFPGDPRTLEALRKACSDPSPQVRLRVARNLGDEGRAILLELAEGLADDECSAQAVSALGGGLPFERKRDHLVGALRRRRHQTARACMEVLGRDGTAEAVAVLEKVLSRETGELAAAAAEALGAAGSEAAEPSLIQALRSERTDVVVAAANALGRVGSAAAVLPLKEAAEDSRDPGLRRATRQAIAEIQSRLQGASPGQLSLAGAEAGRLSLAQAEAGQLSIAADAGGQLTLDDDQQDRS